MQLNDTAPYQRFGMVMEAGRRQRNVRQGMPTGDFTITLKKRGIPSCANTGMLLVQKNDCLLE
jgi:hypothetical protein